MKWTALIMCITLWILLCIGIGLAEENFDYRSDTQLFCGKIAELNIEITDLSTLSGRKSAKPTMVLFLTTEAPLDFANAGFTPLNVVYGPRGFSALTCTDPNTAVEWLLKQESVLYAEIDSDISGCSSEEDETETVTFHSWGAETAGFGAYVVFAEQYGNGSCTIAVIDSGTYRHSLIRPKLVSSGHDYIDNDDDSTNDLNGHGTRVAGIIADCTQGLPVYIYPIRVLDADANGKTSNVICAVLEATDAHVSIINLSLATFTQSELLESAIRSAISAGITVVAAAGNYACNASEVTPACMTDAGIIVVGSAEADGSRSSFSDYGASVDLYFFGRGISCCSRSGGYVADSGTSMAAPHISALSAMVKLIHPSISPENVESRIKASASGNISVPSVLAMIPTSRGFNLTHITLGPDEEIFLPVQALPLTAREKMKYTVLDSEVVSFMEDTGKLKAISAGNTQITAQCKGFEDKIFTVTVDDETRGSIALPLWVECIEAEAFYGLKTGRVIIPKGTKQIEAGAFDGGEIGYVFLSDTVTELGENTFSDAVIVCPEGSFAETYVLEHQMQYIISIQ